VNNVVQYPHFIIKGSSRILNFVKHQFIAPERILLNVILMKSNMNILIVDDDADDRTLFIDAIKEVDAGITCTTANDGKQALDNLKGNYNSLPDFVFLDLRMPRFSGKKCLLEMKADEKLKSIPVVIYTTSNDVEEAKELQDLGAVHFISKPGDPDEIYYVVSFVLEEQLKHLKGS
jgi:DNA-binding NtrC family response regulator